MSAITLPEWMKMIASDPLRAGVVETMYRSERLFQYIPWMTIEGLAYAYDREESLPGVNFRKINGSYTPGFGIVNRLVEVLKPFGCESDCDRALVDAYGEGERTRRAKMDLKAMMAHYLQTMFYGNSPNSRAGTEFDDVDGFDGIQARCGASQIIDAGGSSGSDGSSVFALRFGDDGVAGLQTKSAVDVEDLGILESKPAFRLRVEHIAGLGLFTGKCVGWIKDLTATTNTLTCDDMDELMDLIDGDPDVIVMSKRSRRQLKKNARSQGIVMGTTYDLLGQKMSGWGDVPIVVSDAIIDTETVS